MRSARHHMNRHRRKTYERTGKGTAVAAIAILGIACLDTIAPSDVLSLTDALISLPAGFTSTSNSFGPAYQPARELNKLRNVNGDFLR